MTVLKTTILKLEPSVDKDSTRFYPQELEEINEQDVRISLANGQLIAIVDCNAGGIIGYAIGQNHADMVWMALNQAIYTGPTIKVMPGITKPPIIEVYATVNSSLGYVCFHPETGNAILDCRNGNELDEIDRFDVDEYKKFYNVTEIPTNLDILDIGYWTKSSFYEPAEADWRKEVALLRTGVEPDDLFVTLILLRKKQGTDCTEEESAEIKMWVKEHLINTEDEPLKISKDIQELFPLEYGEAIDEITTCNI